MDSITKGFIIIGVVCIAMGLLWHFGIIQNLKIGRLPGDILIEKENTKIYIPLTTGILISVLVSVVMWLFKR